ncbi:acetate--CoA ligase family protein [Nocardiopsis coralliicola]
MLAPRAVALVGVSGRAASIGSRPLRYLAEQGFAGDVYPVNPHYSELGGYRCYPSLDDLPGPVDLVLVLVPAARAPGVVRQAGRAGAAAAVVFASGFAETGPDGARLQEELVRAGREAGVRVLGPNCQGVLYGPTRMAATFTAAADAPLGDGSGAAYVGQSGAVGGSVLDLAREAGLDLTAWVSTGNQADLDLVEIAAGLVADPAVRVLMLYAEAVSDGAAYTRLAAAARAAGTRLVVLSSGRSDAGRRAAASHTGSMLGDDAAFRLVSAQHGVVLVDDVDELLAVAAVLLRHGRPAGRRVGVVTTSGGAGSLAADHGTDHGLALPELTPATQEALAPAIPDFGALANPVDVTAQLFNREGGDRALGEVCRTVAADPGVDAVAVVLTMVTGAAGERIAADLAETAADLEAPLLVAWLAGREQTAAGRAVFRSAGAPVFGSVAALMRTVSLLADGPAASAAPDRGPAAGAGEDPGAAAAAGALRAALAGHAAAGAGGAVLDALGVHRPAAQLCATAEESAAAAERLGFPAVLKLQADGLDHKSDIGGVRLGVASAAEAAAVHTELLDTARRHGARGVQGVLVQQTAPAGVELLVGATCAGDGYPPVVTVGIGGVTTELYRDTASAAGPVTPERAAALIGTLRGAPLLDGYRGAAPADAAAAASAVSAVARAAAALAAQDPAAAFEFEINPLIAAERGRGAHAVDVLVRAG